MKPRTESRINDVRAKGEIGALTLMRVLLGATMFAHGAAKVRDFPAWQRSLDKLGVWQPELMAYPSAFAEVGGGLLLIVGLATIWAAALLIVEMAAAIFLVHLGHGFFSATGGMELPLFLGATCLYFVLRGAGPVSVDALIAYQSARGEPRRKFALRTLGST